MKPVYKTLVRKLAGNLILPDPLPRSNIEKLRAHIPESEDLISTGLQHVVKPYSPTYVRPRIGLARIDNSRPSHNSLTRTLPLSGIKILEPYPTVNLNNIILRDKALRGELDYLDKIQGLLPEEIKKSGLTAREYYLRKTNRDYEIFGHASPRTGSPAEVYAQTENELSSKEGRLKEILDLMPAKELPKNYYYLKKITNGDTQGTKYAAEIRKALRDITESEPAERWSTFPNADAAYRTNLYDNYAKGRRNQDYMQKSFETPDLVTPEMTAQFEKDLGKSATKFDEFKVDDAFGLDNERRMAFWRKLGDLERELYGPTKSLLPAEKKKVRTKALKGLAKEFNIDYNLIKDYTWFDNSNPALDEFNRGWLEFNPPYWV